MDYLGRHNVTIKEWTDYIRPKILSDGSKLSFRVAETQECELITSSVSERPQMIQSPLDIKQTFSATFRRSFKGNGLQDVRLYPLHNYNITSYFGCYRRVIVSGEKVDGSNPDFFSGTNAFYPQIGEFGCKGTWQSEYGDIVHAYYDTRAKEEKFKVTTGQVEKQITVFLYDVAKRLALAASSLIIFTYI